MSVSVLPPLGREVTSPPLDITQTKSQLKSIWAEILNQDASDFEDEDLFFEVGGDSITALQLVNIARENGLYLTVEQIFLHATLEEMAEVAARSESLATEGPRALQPFGLLNGSPNDVQDKIQQIAESCKVAVPQIQNAYPCSPMQESLVSLSEGSENLSLRQLVYKIPPSLSLQQLQKSWSATVESNEVLRTRICQLPGERRFLQAVVNEDIEWNTATGLSHFLEDDSRTLMTLGSRFFRYAIVEDNSQQYFVWTVHHALCDGASLLEILEEVSTRYRDQAVVKREPFENFIKAITETNDLEEQTFWESTLADVDATPFPTLPQNDNSRNRPPVALTLEELIDVPERIPFGVTRALLLRAAWAILMSHHTGTESVVFGAINNGRNSAAVPGISQMSGPTINLLPIVLKADREQSVASFLATVRSNAADLMPYEHTGVSKIRRYLSDKASTATDFQTVFVVHPAEFGEAGAPALQTMGLEYVDQVGKTEQHAYPLVVSLTLTGASTATIKLQYDERIITTKQARNLTHQYRAVLSQIGTAKESTLLRDISSFSQHDEAQIREWNKFTPLVNNTCIHRLFEEQAARTPTAEAVYSLEKSLTYAELENLASALSLRLVDYGVAVGTPVAVCFEKSAWTAAAILAVFKAGGIYIPIDPAHPHGRITEVIETAKIKVAIASVTGTTAIKGLCDSIIEVDNPKTSPEKITLPEHIQTRVKPSDVAYMLFTSGSTGKPKGVLISHSAFSTSIVNHGAAFGASPAWRTLQFAAHTFDISMTEFCTTLAFGGCICVPSEEDRMNDLAGAITRLNVNVALVVPTVANLLTPAQVPTLKTLVLGGEPVTRETISRWAAHVSLTAGYGPSETSVYCSGNLNVSPDAHPADIGKCIGGNMWIVNSEDYHKLSAIGCVGEIAISGPIVGNGYYGDPQTTAKSFVQAPAWLANIHSYAEHKVLYRTGDLGRYNPDGTFRIVGRSDTQVKLRGFRIELGEIENRIMETGSVVAALAALPPKGHCSRQIVAVVCLNRSELRNHGSSSDKIRLDENADNVALDKVKSRIALTLPDYMIPSVWVTLEKMPLLLSGKIDRRLIKTWIEQMSQDTYNQLVGDVNNGELVEVIPGTTADAIRQVWAQVLKVSVEQIGMKTSFFALGGDSIAAIQVVSSARQAGLPLLTVRGILSQKTLGNLATLVEQSQQSAPQVAQQPVGPQGVEGTAAYTHLLQPRLQEQPQAVVEDSYIFTPIQREILRQREINPRIFVLSWKMEFTSLDSKPVSLERLSKAWNAVVQKHQILRSVFIKDPDGNLPPLQVVLLHAKPSIATSSSQPGEHEPTTDELLPGIDDCFLPHRAHFSRRGNEYFGHIELDHLVIDGWSFRLIKEDLLKAYDSSSAELPPPVHIFKSVVNSHQPSRIEADKKHWLPILRDQKPSRLSFPPTQLGLEKPPSPFKTIIYLPTLNIAKLSDFSSKNSITPASIFDAAWAQTLSIYSGSPDVTYEYVVSGRDQEVEGIFDVVGPVMNLLAFHLRDVNAEDDAQALAAVAHRIQEQRLSDSGNTAGNLREIVQDDLKKELPFNTALNFQRRPLGVETDSLKVYDHLKRSNDPWHFDVLVRILHIMDDNIVRPSIEFDARLFDETKMNEVAGVFWKKVQIAMK